VIASLLDQWAQPRVPPQHLLFQAQTGPASPFANGATVNQQATDKATLAPPGFDSIMRKHPAPRGVLGLGPMAVLQGLPRNPDPAVDGLASSATA